MHEKSIQIHLQKLKTATHLLVKLSTDQFFFTPVAHIGITKDIDMTPLLVKAPCLTKAQLRIQSMLKTELYDI